MYNDLKTKQNEEIKSEGILIFKDTMEYLIDGILTAEQYAELTRMIYATRWGDGVNEKEITDKLLLGIWKTLKHTIKKSARNARYRENNTNKKSVLQEEIKSTEFDIPNNMEDNIENPNKADLNPSNNKEVEQPQPIVNNATESQKMTKNDVKQIIPLRVAASKDFRQSEKLQELINNDDNFWNIYNRCINYIADYNLNPSDFVKSNSKNMAFSRLERLLEENKIIFNDDIKDFINNDVTDKMNTLTINCKFQ